MKNRSNARNLEMLKLQCYIQKVCNYFITPRKLKITSRNSKFRKDKKIGYCDFIGLNMLKSSNMQIYT